MPTPVDKTILIQEELKRGLRRDDRNVRNQYTLAQCQNARPTDRGLEKAPDITDPFDPYDFKTGGELLTNGNFTAGSTGWTFGGDWSASSNRAFMNEGSDVVADRQISQTTSSLINVYYVIRVILEGVSAPDDVLEGELVAWLDLTPAFPVYSRTLLAGVQTYDFVIKSPVANAVFRLQGSEGGYLAVNSISMYAALYGGGGWPSPQLFRGKTETVLAFDGEVHTVDETTTPWGNTQLTTYDGTYYPNQLIKNGDFVTQQYWDLASNWIWNGNTRSVSITAASDIMTYTDPGVSAVGTAQYRLEVECTLGSGTLLATFGGDNAAIVDGSNVITLNPSTSGSLLITASTAVATITKIHLYRDETAYTTAVTGGGGPWNFVDAHGFWVLINDSNVIIRNPVGSNRVYKIPTNTATSCCEYKGRMMFAGFDDTKTYGLWGTLKPNCVWWSSVGGGDVVELFRPSIRDADVMDSYIKRNDGGYSVMPWQGSIVQMVALNTGVLVLGEQGVAMLRQYNEPSPTFGTENIVDQVGLISRGAAVAGKDRAVFVDTSGNVWQVEENGRAERLGYEEYFQPLLTEDIVASYDSQHDEFWFTTPETCYVLNRLGMGENNKLPTSINYVDGGLVGVQYYQKTFTLFDDGEHIDDFAVSIDTFDMETREVKTIHSIEVGITDPTVVEAAISYRYNKGGSFTTTDWKTLDAGGFAVFLVSGVEFQLKIRTEEFSETVLDYIQINWRQNRKKSVRELIQSA